MIQAVIGNASDDHPKVRKRHRRNTVIPIATGKYNEGSDNWRYFVRGGYLGLRAFGKRRHASAEQVPQLLSASEQNRAVESRSDAAEIEAQAMRIQEKAW